MHHLLGLATAVVLYALLVRWGVWLWLATGAAVPALLATATGEQLSLSDATFVLVVTAAVLVAAWQAPPAPAGLLAGGLLLAVAVVLCIVPATVNGVSRGQPALTVPGLALLACAIAGLAAALGVGRARGSGMHLVCLQTVLLPVAALVAAAAYDDLASRGEVLATALWPAAGALGLTALMRGRRGPSAIRPRADAHDLQALAAFGSRYADPRLGPVVIVIAAYNEATSIAAVLSSMPSTVCGLAADVLVVDDGSGDGTAEAVEAQGGAYLVASGVNRGQGAALRLGYRTAREHGARYLITTDADGQYDPDDMPVVLAPLLEGTADFVTGSRRLGHQETRDRFRRAGVYVFAWTVSALTGHWLTDTSFGLRAMRAEVTEVVTLNEPQYQSSELLIGALSHGFTVTEVVGHMRIRAAGSTKKGRNLVYGTRYARVVLGTWWREGCPAPARERAPAMAGRPDRTTSGLRWRARA